MGRLCHLQIPSLVQNPLALIGFCHSLCICLVPIEYKRLATPTDYELNFGYFANRANEDCRDLKSYQAKLGSKNHNHKAQSTTAIIPGPIELAAA